MKSIFKEHICSVSCVYYFAINISQNLFGGLSCQGPFGGLNSSFCWQNSDAFQTQAMRHTAPDLVESFSNTQKSIF